VFLEIRAEVSLYPIESDDADEVINTAISCLDDEDIDVDYEVGEVSTQIKGEPDQVWAGIRQIFESAISQGGEVAMVVTVTNSSIEPEYD
jgi:uncharacterized protein YqgV (UPF0045/DUF77 family)